MPYACLGDRASVGTLSSIAFIVIIGLVAGFHAALYGAYKDSPHESFLVRRFVRELVFSTSAAAVLAALRLADGQTLFIIYLSVFALSRIITEFWKLFLRVEPQDGYRIPTQIHWVKGVMNNPIIRLAMGIGFVSGIYGCYCLFRTLPKSLPSTAIGLIVGGGIGLAEAMAGAYKDGTIEIRLRTRNTATAPIAIADVIDITNPDACPSSRLTVDSGKLWLAGNR